MARVLDKLPREYNKLGTLVSRVTHDSVSLFMCLCMFFKSLSPVPGSRTDL